jgi:hypothetical protein
MRDLRPELSEGPSLPSYGNESRRAPTVTAVLDTVNALLEGIGERINGRLGTPHLASPVLQ